jgi:serine/threonine protein phosphatase 1
VRCAANERFVTIRGATRIWAVGAIHGEAAKLRRLHAAVEERFETGDRVVYLGNYLGRGSEIAETLDELVAFRRALLAIPDHRVCDVIHLRGRQEEMWRKLLQIHLAVEPASVLGWMLNQGVRETLETYGGEAASALRRARSGAQEVARWTNEIRAGMNRHPGHSELLGSLRRAAITEDGALLFVSAGIDPERPIDAQGDTFWWGSDALDRMNSPYSSFKKIIRGFDPSHRGIHLEKYVATVDGGAGFGGDIAAICFGVDGEEIDRVE